MLNYSSNSFEQQAGELMRKWYLPMTVMGLGGLGVLLFTDRGRRAIRWAVENMPHAQSRLAEWNETAQRELDRIQTALNRVAESLDSMETAR
jgi:hypothetical protein